MVPGAFLCAFFRLLRLGLGAGEWDVDGLELGLGLGLWLGLAGWLGLGDAVPFAARDPCAAGRSTKPAAMAVMPSSAVSNRDLL
ncbi:MAG TPA: hypothetical protein VF940_08530 [Streptosporangiaceae bacterium]